MIERGYYQASMTRVDLGGQHGWTVDLARRWQFSSGCHKAMANVDLVDLAS
jgi:hypothetical protein